MTADDSGKKSWRTGCGYVVFSLIFFLLVAGLVALRPVREAKRVEEQLNSRFGVASGFTPNPDGSVMPGRMVAFLTIREQLEQECDGFRDRQAQLDRLGRSEATGDMEAHDLLEGIKAAFGGGSGFFRLVRTRNRALTEAGMGIGEYCYIFTAAYNRQLSAFIEGPDAVEPFKTRTRNELTRILRNQLAVLEMSRHAAEHEALVVDLRGEISALETGAHSIPWQDGLPSDLEASVEPFRARLDELFCEPAVRFELRQKNQHPSGLGR